MQFLIELWIPIVVASVVLFFVSAFAWMVLPHHNKLDWSKLPDEDGFIGALKGSNVAPGRYMFPHVNSHQEAQQPEFQEKYKSGPVGTLTIFGKVNMGVNMLWTFVFFLVCNAMLAYLAWFALRQQESQSFLDIWRFVGTAAILTYSCSAIPNDIWFKRPSLTNVIDGIVYGLICGLVFASLWPK
jgi:hypothetical protein